MRIGMALPQHGEYATRENIARVAREAEAIGLDSLWTLDRLLRPTRAISVAPGLPAQPLPRYYATVFDPLETLTYAVALTTRVQLGTSVINALFHPPVILGKRFATLDQLSGGRVIAGVGQGWMSDEFAVAGVPHARQGAGMADWVAAVRAVWGPDPVRYDRRFYQIPEAEIGPKPVQPGGPPLIFGCYAPAAIARAGRIADGFNPLAAEREGLLREIAIFRDAAREAGRNVEALPIIARANAELADSPLPEIGRALFAGTVAQWAEDVAWMATLGIDHVFFAIDGPIDRRLQALAALRESVTAND
ncbi:MAG TPA: TIGR03619 family F420-dependent LLM class oxidoreductase [Thermomicrobiales bacterium]|jgi:probable F420-dependent oxidoreductase